MTSVANEDELLQHLVQAARQRQEEKDRSTEEVDALTDEVLANYDTESFGTEFQAGVVSRLQDELPARSIPPSLPRRSFGQPSWYGPLAWAASITLVVGLLVWFVLARSWSQTSQPTPTYTIATALGVSSERATEVTETETTETTEERITAVPGYRFEVRLRPATKPTDPLGVRVYAADAGGRLFPWREAEANLEILESGVVVLSGLDSAAWQSLTPGDWTLYFAVGPPETLPTAAELRTVLAGTVPAPTAVVPERSWQLLSQEIHVAEAI